MNHVTVIGAGLAGSECAWQLAQRGISVTLREMKPEKLTPAHQTADFAELCCSNSLRAAGLENAVGLLKEELRQLRKPFDPLRGRDRRPRRRSPGGGSPRLFPAGNGAGQKPPPDHRGPR